MILVTPKEVEDPKKPSLVLEPPSKTEWIHVSKNKRAPTTQPRNI